MENQNLEDFKGFDIKIEYQKICDEWAEKCKEEIKAKSPTEEHSSRSGQYRDGWATKGETDGENIYSVKVWNSTDWQLTHLLENGHLIANKRNGVGWSPAKPHIATGFQAVKNKFIKAVKKAELKITQK